MVDRIATGLVADLAPRLDEEARFPDAAVAALREAGLLGLASSPEVGGLGLGLSEAAYACERLARHCASTARVLGMHYVGASLVEALGSAQQRHAVAAGDHLLAIALNAGSSSAWRAGGQAEAVDGGVALTGRKSFVTGAGRVTAYVWSSPAVDPATHPTGEGQTLWLVPRETPGLIQRPVARGLGLRATGAGPIEAAGARVPDSARLGADGDGERILRQQALPWLTSLGTACILGMMEAAALRTQVHVASLRDDRRGRPEPEAKLFTLVARLRIATDSVRLLLERALAAVEAGDPAAGLLTLEARAAAGEAANVLLESAAQHCGGDRGDPAADRCQRDWRATTGMAPPTEALFEAIGRGVCGLTGLAGA